MSKTWIFQASSDRWDARRGLAALDVVEYKVARYADQIEPDDRVYFWISGSGGGLYARGTILDSPSERPWHPDGFEIDQRPEGTRMAVLVTVDEVLGEPIARGAVRADARLAELSLLRQPQGTNYPVSIAEAQVLDELFADALVLAGEFSWTLPGTKAPEGDAAETIVRNIRDQKHASWSNLKKAVRLLQGREHEPFGSINVENSSKSHIRTMLRETELELPQLQVVIDRLAGEGRTGRPVGTTSGTSARDEAVRALAGDPAAVIGLIRAQSRASWSNLRKAVRSLQGLGHEPFGTHNVENSSKSHVRRMQRETGLDLVQLQELIDNLAGR